MCGTSLPRMTWTHRPYLYTRQEECQEGRAGHHPSPPSGAAAKFECGGNDVVDSRHDASDADVRGALSHEFLVATPLDVDGLKRCSWPSNPDAITNISTASLSTNSPSRSSSSPVSVTAASDTHFLTCAPSSSAIASAVKGRRKRAPQRPGKTAKQNERLFVKHDYHDLATSSSFSNVSPQSQSFPLKLHCILEESEAAGLGHIISWQPHGRAFKIHNPKLFAEQIMRKYFPKTTKVASFQRQFNLYGFERITRDGPDAGAYYHEAFLRHFPGLSLQRMSRRRVKGTGYKAASNPEMEPDLYAFPSMDEVLRKRATGADSAISLQSSTNLFHSHAGFLTRQHNSMYEPTRNEDAPTYPAMMPSYVDELSTSQYQERNYSPIPQSLASAQMTMDDFSSSSEENQDWLPEDVFAKYDFTPLSAFPGSRQHEQHQAHHPILLEFAELWESGSFRPTL